mmetsp:Transcript_26751/g.39601  ORF Transcript_26751/g.39601 Transcript_26751/m.39601 type:complete len:99 (-) Transcript_26751:348-644(-)
MFKIFMKATDVTMFLDCGLTKICIYLKVIPNFGNFWSKSNHSSTSRTGPTIPQGRHRKRTQISNSTCTFFSMRFTTGFANEKDQKQCAIHEALFFPPT